MRLRGRWALGLTVLLSACHRPPDIPVGPIGMPIEIEGSQVSSFLCSNEKHFSIAYAPDGIVFSTGLGIQALKISGNASGVRYDGGHFTIVTTANRATVYYDGEAVMTDCLAIEY